MMGFEVHPLPEDPRHDIIQTIAFGKPEPLCRFCEGIQAGAPVDSFVTPVPWDMPGYQDQVIMAAGAFVQGASIELSADAPMREPYVCYMQGGLTYASGKMGVLLAAQRIMQPAMESNAKNKRVLSNRREFLVNLRKMWYTKQVYNLQRRCTC